MSIRITIAALRHPLTVLATAVLAGCGGGGSENTGTSIADGFGPGNPSSCPHAQLDDVWLNRRLGCLAVGQRFVQNGGATGEAADRAYIVGQQVLDGKLVNVLGGTKLRYFKYAVCLQGAPANLGPTLVMTDLGVAVGLNSLATGSAFLPPSVSGSVFNYGGIVDVNTLTAPCDPAKHPVIVSYATGRITSVNTAALANLQVFDQ